MRGGEGKEKESRGEKGEGRERGRERKLEGRR